MTPPVQPVHDRVAQVRAALEAGHSISDVADHLDRVGETSYAHELREAQRGKFSNFMGQVAHGMSSSMSDQLLAAGGAVASKITGDQRPLGGIYNTLKDDAKTRREAYAQEYPKTALAGQVLGGIATSKVVPLPNVAGSGTVARRAISAGVQGGAINATSGFVNGAPGERVNNAVVQGGIGFLGGMVAAPALEGVQSGGRMIRALASGAPTVPGVSIAPRVPVVPVPTASVAGASPGTSLAQRARAAVGLPPGDEAVPGGVRRMLARLESQGKSVADLERDVAAGQAPDIVGEAAGEMGPRDLKTARTLGYRAPDRIRKALDARGREEVGRVRDVVKQHVGPMLDNEQFAADKLNEAQTTSKPLYDAAVEGRSVTDPRILEISKSPDLASAYKTAERFAANDRAPIPSLAEFRAAVEPVKNVSKILDAHGQAIPLPDAAGSDPTLPAKTIQLWKLAVDDRIKALEGSTGGTSTHEYGQAVQLQKEVESLLADHPTIGPDWRKAQQAYAKPMQELDDFQTGQKEGRTLTSADVPRLTSVKNPGMTARGVGNTLLEDLDRMRDGGAGPIRDPGPLVAGHEQARSRVAVATQLDPTKARAIEEAGQGASRRLATRNTVLTGSQTTPNAIDVGDHLMDEKFVGKAVSGPLKAAGDVVGKMFAGLRRRATGRELDQMAEILLAGAPGEMTKPEAIAHLKKFEPILQRAWARQARNAGALGGTATRAAQNR